MKTNTFGLAAMGLLFLCITIALIVQSCAVPIASVGTAITTIELAAEVYEKVEELHKAGAPPSVLEQVHTALSDAHEIIDKHHRAHVE